MSQQRKEKLKPLLQDVPQGYLVDTAWLKAREIDRKSIHNYEKHGWLERLARGVYRRPAAEDTVHDWQTVVLSGQTLMDYDFHVGGRTALSLQGFDHYVRFSADQNVHLYGRVPPWLKRLPGFERYHVHRRSLFNDDQLGVETGREADIITGWAITRSTPERAIFEVLDQLPDDETFHVVDTLFEGLGSARPKLLNALLTVCRKKYVRRLFFVFADRHPHGWRKYVTPEDHDLGTGSRAFVEGGRLHPVYDLTVPGEFLPHKEEETDGV